VMAAGRPSSEGYQEALETLLGMYWFPLYAYLRRHGSSRDQAADFTQAFFAKLMEKQYLKGVEPRPGKFRSFLLAALKHFISNQRDRDRAKKRGGGRKILSLDFDSAENQYALEPADKLTPEKLFEKSWALTVLQRTMGRLEAELAAKGKQKLFDHLKCYLAADIGLVPYRKVASELRMSESAVKTTVHRMRRRCRQLLRDEIAQTVASEEQIDDEIRGLFAALAY
ncbi:MAG: sigma-70 family RNA polymerase sigma factor, partial [Sedimentisphaerales bacterium]|nr:sigma-70 family RNA polymerase sigma factor [Sedimentisphaerales bacterium]